LFHHRLVETIEEFALLPGGFAIALKNSTEFTGDAAPRPSGTVEAGGRGKDDYENASREKLLRHGGHAE
jgi:hypothetical protein